MKKIIYRFYYDEPVEEVINYIRKETKTPNERVNYGDYYCNIKGNYIRMFKYNWWLRKLAQRDFIGSIDSYGNGTVIKGEFKYSKIDKLACMAIALLLLCGHSSMLFSNISIQEKLQNSIPLIVFYALIGLLLILGKVIYKKEEQAVLELLGVKATKRESEK